MGEVFGGVIYGNYFFLLGYRALKGKHRKIERIGRPQGCLFYLGIRSSRNALYIGISRGGTGKRAFGVVVGRDMIFEQKPANKHQLAGNLKLERNRFSHHPIG